MALKPLNKNGTVADTDLSDRKNLASAGLFKIDGDGNIEDSDFGKFLLNPSSLEETKSANWIQNVIPGQSDPILQWMSSGPRIVNFTALVTGETSHFDSSSISAPQKKAPAQNVLSKLASSFFNVTLPTPRQDAAASEATSIEKKLDISGHLNYYRSLLYPLYDNANNPRKLRRSPPLVVLYAGNSISKTAHGLPGLAKVGSNHDLWVVTNLRIRITKQLPNLAPMEAEVSFTLMQYTIKSRSRDLFHDRRSEAPGGPTGDFPSGFGGSFSNFS